MILVKNSQTNWKYILIVVILALLVSVGILYYWRIVKQEFSFVDFTPIKKVEKIELLEEAIINKIINENLPTGYDKRWTNHWKGDLNNDGSLEIIITAIPSERASQAYLVVTLLNNKGDYRKIADFNFDDTTREKYDIHGELTFGAPPGIEIIMVKDINNDGLIEMQLSWWIGSARPFMEDAFLVLDLSRQKIDLLQLIDENGKVVPAIFGTGTGGGTGGYFVGNVYLFDLNKDGRLEIVHITQWFSFEELRLEKWQAKVYQWDGSIFSYNKELSVSDVGAMPEWLRKILESAP